MGLLNPPWICLLFDFTPKVAISILTSLISTCSMQSSNFQIPLFQSSDGSEHAEIVTMCCVLKPIAAWNLEEVVSVGRERCGGQVIGSDTSFRGLQKCHNNNRLPLQGYLSVNRFGTFLGLAHAAMTAEGDNSVLMQKVAKERLGEISKAGFEILNDMNDAGMEYEHGTTYIGVQYGLWS